MKTLLANYTFNAAGKAVTLTDIATVRLDRLFYIMNVTQQVTYYEAGTTGYAATVATNVVTLNAAVSTTGHNNTDKLIIVYDDGFYVGNLASGTGVPGQMVAAGATEFYFSTVNSSTAQLAASATFTGGIESVVNAQALSVLLTSDQPGTLTLKQFIDAGGTRVISSWAFAVVAGVPYSRGFVANGNYFQLTFQNTGGSTTTTLNINTAFGTLPASTNLGYSPIALNEVGGTAFGLGQQANAASLPVVLSTLQESYLARIPAAGPAVPANCQPVTLASGLTVAGASYNSTTGLINVDLLTGSTSGWYDAIAFLGRSLSFVMATGASTAGTITYEQTDDTTLDPSGFGLNCQDATLSTSASSGSQALAASTFYRRECPILHRYVRLRISTAISAGTVQVTAQFSPVPYQPRVLTVAQATAGSLNATIASLPAGTNLAADVGIQARATTGGLTTACNRLVSAAATTNGTVVKASAGRLYKITGYNAAASLRYLKFSNAATITVGTTAVVFTLVLPASSAFEFNVADYGVFFSTGICYGITTVSADADTTACTAGDIVQLNVFFL